MAGLWPAVGRALHGAHAVLLPVSVFDHHQLAANAPVDKLKLSYDMHFLFRL